MGQQTECPACHGQHEWQHHGKPKEQGKNQCTPPYSTVRLTFFDFSSPVALSTVPGPLHPPWSLHPLPNTTLACAVGLGGHPTAAPSSHSQLIGNQN
jgi:hypothetical protein